MFMSICSNLQSIREKYEKRSKLKQKEREQLLQKSIQMKLYLTMKRFRHDYGGCWQVSNLPFIQVI